MFLNKSTEKSSSLMDDAAHSADQAIKSTQQMASDALENLTSALQDLSHQATPAIERAGDRVSSLAHRSLDGVRETTHQLRVKVEHASDNTVNYIRHEPVKSVLFAAATGAAVMALISLLSHTPRSR